MMPVPLVPNDDEANARSPTDPRVSHVIEAHPHKWGNADARVKGTGISVWVLADALRAHHGEIRAVAKDYGLSDEAVEAVAHFYDEHREEIDERIAENAAFFAGQQ